MRHLVALGLLIAGVIHLLPLTGLLGSAHLAALYGLPFDEPNLAILMRHRAVLFGLLGAYLVLAAFKPAHRVIACVGGLISVVAFLALAWSTGGTNPQLDRVVLADLVALAGLLVSAAAMAWSTRHS